MKRLIASALMLLLSLGSQAQMRLVSIDGSITEIIYALGGEQQLVGVDTTSRYPHAATQLPDVGYMRQLSVEGILSLTPTTVIATEDAGPEAVFSQLKAAGVEVVRLQDEASVAGVQAKIAAVAQLMGREAQGKALQQQVEQQVAQARQRLAPLAGKRALLLLGAGNRGLMAAGQGTQGQALLHMLGLKNVVGYQGYKPLSPESALAAAPEVVIVAQTGPLEASSVKQQLALTPAVKNDQLVMLDAGLLLGFGPRLGAALQQLEQALVVPAVAEH
ncbi:hemin ABC transporter substrate-binding protein [Bacterioplanes sanyensis]|uniref:heme/hemin ABC transporter substrate-binding protein n=1 Tax=Bacterioplanes sanyensis TaxID=1249553 RepID=UPI001679F5AD|nr:ABC transporter substrate-binding protein [Bacterioplanes sanyensis]GGY52186.1 hemin ABC transporter substrate-binding protein [Bacterioplanes sanyensis]